MQIRLGALLVLVAVVLTVPGAHAAGGPSRPADDAPVVHIVRSSSHGFDWASAVIGASVPLALLALDLLVRPAITQWPGRIHHHTRGGDA